MAEYKLRKKAKLTKNGAMGFALKQWNKIAPEYGFAQTQRKDDQRLASIKKIVRVMEKLGIDWREKDSWRAAFRKVGQAKAEIEKQHGDSNFRVTFDYAICLRNTGHIMGLGE